MRYFYSILVSVIICSLFLSCSTNSDPPIQLNLDGFFGKGSLTKQKVNRLKIDEAHIYAGTDEGFFHTPTEGDNTKWEPLFQQKGVYDFVVWNQQEFLIGTPISSSEEVSIFTSVDGGNSWSPSQNGFGTKDKNNHLFIVKKHPQKPEVLWARGDFNVAMSPDSGKTWDNLLGNWGGYGGGYFLTINASDPQVIWGGGVTASFTPHLFQTTDGGENWRNINIIENVETTVYEIATHASSVNKVLAGLGIGVRKSADGGQSWQTVLQNISIYTLAHSTRNPEVVYASGRNTSGTLFFAASGNFGDTWQTVEMKDSPTDLQVNDMISVTENGQETLYLGTNKGLYSYQFEK